LDGGPAKVVIKTSMMAFYASGYLVYSSHGDLVVRPFDPDTGELSGSQTPIVEDVLSLPGAAKAAFSVSTGGALAYLQGEAAQDASLTWRDRHGAELEQVGDLATYDMVTLSPDGTMAATGIIEDQSGTWDIWIVDLARKFRSRFTFDPADDFDMVWTSDSRGLYFVSDRDGNMKVLHKEVGSPAEPREVFDIGGDIRLWDCSPDGRTLFYSAVGEGTLWDLWSVDLSGETENRLIHRSSENDASARISPDGAWLLFSTQESGRTQVYVAPWPAMTPVTQVSVTSGTWADWTRDGSEIIFQEENGRLVAVTMTVGANGRALIGEPAPLFDFISPEFETVGWAATGDGEKFLTVNAFHTETPPYFNLVLDWPALLERR
ncbi:MAG: hypothetical protein ABFS42_16010, partial [Candidatus Krumholzibacteriota bacterium]